MQRVDFPACAPLVYFTCCFLENYSEAGVCMNEKLIPLLYHLGLSANYMGFSCITSAVDIAICEPQSLTMVTKWLYPQVAKQRKTNWKAVERNIRSSIDIIWKRNPTGLQQLSPCLMDSKPTTAQFISYLVFYLQFDEP